MFRSSPYCAKLYSRYVFSDTDASWIDGKSAICRALVEQLRVCALMSRPTLYNDLFPKLEGLGIIADAEALADAARFSSATLSLAVIPIMSTNGYLTEAYVLPEDLNGVAKCLEACGERIQRSGILTISTLERMRPSLWADRQSGWELTLLEHMAALGFGEFRRHGCLFYRASRPE
jgi:hypothetical protein